MQDEKKTEKNDEKKTEISDEKLKDVSGGVLLIKKDSLKRNDLVK